MRYQRGEGDGAHGRGFTWLSSAIVAAGIALRLWQYLGRSALWSDEAAVANNIVSRGYAHLLLHPLANNQAAPVGFLLIEKVAASIFGANELALRVYPLLCSMLALLLLWRVARRLLPPASVALVLIPFAFARPMLFYAAEVKQYSSDLAIALVLLLVALELSDGASKTRALAGAAIIGALAVWLSQPAVLVVAGLGGALLVTSYIDARGAGERREVRALAPIGSVVAAWGLSALGATLVSLRHLTPASQHFMRVFWGDGFWPLSLAHPSSVAWPAQRVPFILGNQLGIPTSIGFACVLLAAVGVILTWRTDWRVFTLLLAPLVVALGASATHLYPFGDRLALFLIPSLLLLATIGITGMAALVPAPRGASLVLVSATVFLLVVEAQALRTAPPVYRREEITPALAYLRAKSTAGDAVYVYYGAVPAYTFYDGGAPFPARATMGGCHRGDARGYLTELDAQRGRARVWMLFAHESWRLGERELMLRYLDAIGTVRDSTTSLGRDVEGKPTIVRLYLYDLSDSARLASAQASDLPIPKSGALEERQQCAPASE
ncbi:MAG: glycosyltransferase family 39 protein [Gemmatimonadaceae bacterium]